MPCTVCNHPERADIDLALLAGDTLKSLHQRYGLSPSALHRHKQHLESKMRSVRYRLDQRQDQGCLLELNEILVDVRQGIKTAAANGETDRVFRGAAIASRLIKQMHSMKVEWEIDTVYRLTFHAAAASMDSLLPVGPGALADLNRALLAKASSPCPDPENEADRQDTASASECNSSNLALETKNWKLETLSARSQCPEPEGEEYGAGRAVAAAETPAEASNDEISQFEVFEIIQGLLPGVNLSPDDISLPCGTEPANNRKTSEESPAETAPKIFNIEENQEDVAGEEYLPANVIAVAADEETSPPPYMENGKLRTESGLLTACCSLSPDNISLSSGNETENNRKISEKSPAKAAPKIDIIEENQEDIAGEKFLPANAIAVAADEVPSPPPYTENGKLRTENGLLKCHSLSCTHWAHRGLSVLNSQLSESMIW